MWYEYVLYDTWYVGRALLTQQQQWCLYIQCRLMPAMYVVPVKSLGTDGIT